MTPVRYTVRFPAPQSHYAEVEARISGAQAHQVELFLPVWTPGSYLIREYARNIESLVATDAHLTPLSVTKTRKNRWLVTSSHPLDEIVISYRLYCHELTVRTNWLDENFALLNGGATFLTVVNTLNRPHEVKLELPPEWQGSWSGMPGKGNVFTAPDYDTLVDSPIIAGCPTVNEFDVDGRPHLLVNIGETSLWNIPEAVHDIQKIVRQHCAMWGGLPYERYLFLNLLNGGRGALEHRNSVVLMADRFVMRKRDSYVAWLHLISHEHFHVWNVKQLRPVELGPFDYENEVYTRNLWIAEGFTEYYGLLAVRRAGLTSNDEFLGTQPVDARHEPESLSGLLEKLRNTPGRLEQPASLASFDAWIKLYRPDENSVNSSISYYTKGAVIAWLLDAKIRLATGDSRSLDDVMRVAGEQFGGSKGFSTEEFRSVAQEVAGENLNEWFHYVADTTEELAYSEALHWFGLRFKPCETIAKAWLGCSTQTDRGRLIVTRVPRGTPAWDAGISPADEILGINDFRVLAEQWDERLDQCRPYEEISLFISRQERMTRIPIRLGQQPTRLLLEVDPDANEGQRQHFTRWLTTGP